MPNCNIARSLILIGLWAYVQNLSAGDSTDSQAAAAAIRRAGGRVEVEPDLVLSAHEESLPAAPDMFGFKDLSGCNITLGAAKNVRTSAWLDGLTVDEELIANVCRLENVTFLGLSNVEITEAQFARLPLARLQALELGGAQVTDFMVRSGLSCPDLFSLTLERVDLRGPAIELIANPRGLRNLVLDGSIVSTGGVKAIGSLRNLERLDLKETRFECKDLAPLEGLRSLKELYMQTSQGGGADLRFIRKLDNLRILNMSRPDLSDEDLACVEDLTQLERLSAVSTDGFTDSGLIHLRRLHALYGLNIFSNALSDSGICGLLPSPTMRKLIFGSPQISDAAVAYIVQAFPYIEYLELTGTKITANGLQQLQKLSELRTLRLITTCIGDDDLEFVANLHDLTELVVGIPQVTDNGLRHLRSLSNLRVLDLQETAVTDAGVRDLLSNSLNCLTTLRVGHTTVSEELVRELQAIRPQLFIERQ